MRNIPDVLCRENKKKYFMLKNVSCNRALYEIMWKNLKEPEWPYMTI
jgi:hypothetical protein